MPHKNASISDLSLRGPNLACKTHDVICWNSLDLVFLADTPDFYEYHIWQKRSQNITLKIF